MKASSVRCQADAPVQGTDLSTLPAHTVRKGSNEDDGSDLFSNQLNPLYSCQFPIVTTSGVQQPEKEEKLIHILCRMHTIKEAWVACYHGTFLTIHIYVNFLTWMARMFLNPWICSSSKWSIYFDRQVWVRRCIAAENLGVHGTRNFINCIGYHKIPVSCLHAVVNLALQN